MEEVYAPEMPHPSLPGPVYGVFRGPRQPLSVHGRSPPRTASLKGSV